MLAVPGRRDVAHFAATIGMRRVDFPAAKWDPFLNVNTPEDLAAARAIAEGGEHEKTVAIGGLGAIGLKLARALDAGVDGLQLIAVAARDQAKARGQSARRSVRRRAWCRWPNWRRPTSWWRRRRPRCSRQIAGAAIEAGRIFVPASVGALLPRMHLVRRAQETGARIVVPTGALLGLDAVRAAAEGPVEASPSKAASRRAGWRARPIWCSTASTSAASTAASVCSQGNAFDAAAGFPANVNVAAALALAGIGPMRTRVEIWADPDHHRNIHTIRVEAEAARFTMTIENVPSPENPRTGQITALSMLACLRGLVSTLKVGT